MIPTPDDVQRAAGLFSGRIRRTPYLGDASWQRRSIGLKLELLQHTNSFKARGALHRLLTSTIGEAGVIAASGGNHGAAVAWAASTLGHRAEIYVPATSPALKAERIRSYGAHVVIGGDRYDDAQAAADVRQQQTGALMVHPFNHADTVAGAGTCAMELEQQSGGVDTVLVSTGGGGLTAGTATWFAGTRRVVSVEPETSQCLAAALRAGRPVPVMVDGVAIDSLGAKQVGDVPFACATAYGVEAITIPDQAIVAAQGWFWSELRLIVEPGGAAAMGALLCGAYRPEPNERVAVIVCGANCDPRTVTS